MKEDVWMSKPKKHVSKSVSSSLEPPTDTQYDYHILPPMLCGKGN